MESLPEGWRESASRRVRPDVQSAQGRLGAEGSPLVVKMPAKGGIRVSVSGAVPARRGRPCWLINRTLSRFLSPLQVDGGARAPWAAWTPHETAIRSPTRTATHGAAAVHGGVSPGPG
jgi:hypothetical protein